MILYAHLCEKAFVSQNGNLNLIGIFETINAQQFPVVFPQLSIVTVLEGELGEHEQVIKILHEETQAEILSPISVKMNINPKNPEAPVQEKPGTLRIIGDINNLTIKEPGNYRVQILMDGVPQYQIRFKAQKSQKPIPEGR